MLDAFVNDQRKEIIFRTAARVAKRTGPKPQLPDGIPAFLDQLVEALRLADATEQIDHEEIRRSAAKQGNQLLHMGRTIEEVVHEYGDVCQVITELAIERHLNVPTDEFRVMNLCLDDAIAEAVTSFTSHRKQPAQNPGVEAANQLAHEMRNLVETAKTSFAIIRRGQVAPGGSTGNILDRTLLALGELVDRALAGESTRN